MLRTLQVGEHKFLLTITKHEMSQGRNSCTAHIPASRTMVQSAAELDNGRWALSLD